MLTKEILTRMWPSCERWCPGLIDGILATQVRVLTKYNLTSPLVLAHFMAQISHEFGAGHDMVENLNYTAERMTQVWPSRFPNVASAEPYAHNPQKLANKVYNGRMGNAVGSDDGWNFRGRGGSQTTGREAYTKLGASLGLDLVNHPEFLSSPEHFLECAAGDFIMCGCLPFAQKDDVVGVTKRLNGGTIGLAERKQWLAKWRTQPLSATAPPVPPSPTIVPAPIPPPPDIHPVPPAPQQTGWLAALLSIFKRKAYSP